MIPERQSRNSAKGVLMAVVSPCTLRTVKDTWYGKHGVHWAPIALLIIHKLYRKRTASATDMGSILFLRAASLLSPWSVMRKVLSLKKIQTASNSGGGTTV